MNLKNSLISGTILLTLSGLLSRVIGFFYRISLSRHFGEEGMGIYQLITPLLGLTYALCISGIQSAIAKKIAENASKKVLYTGLLISLCLSSLCTLLLFGNASFIAEEIFFEKRLVPLIKVLALSLPFSTVHSCINGYFIGTKKAKFPALLQLIEQLARVLSVLFIFYLNDKKGTDTPLYVAVLGLFIGEIFSSLFSLLFFSREKNQKSSQRAATSVSIVWGILKFSIPLTFTRLIVGLLQSLENIYIPQNLLLAGYSTEEALSVFGVLSGMALPLVLFPTAITNSLSSMLMPAVSEQTALNTTQNLKNTLKKSISFCMFLGFVCFLAFFVSGKFLGNLLFDSTIAGTFIMALSFICPFMYTNTSLGAVINGLGKTGFTFFIHVVSTLIRLIFVFVFVPSFGILAYFWGILLSQLFNFFVSFFYINKCFCLFSFRTKK